MNHEEVQEHPTPLLSKSNKPNFYSIFQDPCLQVGLEAQLTEGEASLLRLARSRTRRALPAVRFLGTGDPELCQTLQRPLLGKGDACPLGPGGCAMQGVPQPSQAFAFRHSTACPSTGTPRMTSTCGREPTRRNWRRSILETILRDCLRYVLRLACLSFRQHNVALFNLNEAKVLVRGSAYQARWPCAQAILIVIQTRFHQRMHAKSTF